MLKDLLFPKLCLNCGFLGAYICLKCQQKLVYIERDTCLYCGRASFFGLTHPGCIRHGGIDGCTAILKYSTELKRIIKSIKYRLATEALQELFTILDPAHLKKLTTYEKLAMSFMIQPLPLHPTRLKMRGFNQAEFIANFLVRLTSYPLISGVTRIRATPPQAHFQKRSDRYANIRGAFAADDTVSQKNIILVDDVVTTGSTVKEAARALKKSGASKVFVFALAKG